jgi:hypothetical protein
LLHLLFLTLTILTLLTILTMLYGHRYNEHGAVVVDGRSCPPLTAAFATQRAAEARRGWG